MDTVKQHLKTILCSYSEIFFLRQWWVGLVLLGLTAINPNVCINGLVAMAAAYGCAVFLKLDKTFLSSGFYTYNPLLVGLSMGFLFRIAPLTCLIVALAGILTFMVTYMLYNITWYYLRLPILSLPFVLLSSLAYLASSRYSNLLVEGLYPQFFSQWEVHLPLWCHGLLKSLGAIIFMPQVSVGALLLVVLLCCSRILVFLALLGYFSGTLVTALLTGSTQQAFADVNHFNFIWIAIALGGIFLVPSLKSYTVAVVAVACSTLFIHAIEVFWASYGIPAFALPFNLVTLTFLYVLGLCNFPLVSPVIKGTPEATLDYYIATTQRFKGTTRTLSLPFAGQWTVWQGPNGRWTHQGSWQHAYDFVITDDQKHTYQGNGQALTDYYAYGKPILSPVRGRIARVTTNLSDNAPGQTDKANNWGNLVLIQDPRGFWVELSHFKQNSIRVEEGQWVEKGHLLGHCGNSGYSPQPHIHVQVQSNEEIGAPTLPFSFLNFTCQNRYYANDLPPENEQVESLPQDKGMTRRLTFLLDQVLTFEVVQSGQYRETITWTVKMAPDGTFTLDSGKGLLYFGIHEGTFYCYHSEGRDRWLNLLFMALPRLPLVRPGSFNWEDFIPISTLQQGLKQAALLFFSSFCHKLNQIKVVCEWTGPEQIRSTITSPTLGLKTQAQVELDPNQGFKRLVFNEWELKSIPTQEVRS